MIDKFSFFLLLFLIITALNCLEISEDSCSIYDHETLEENILKESRDKLETMEEIVTKAGYPIERYNVTTFDGYILTIFRIPFGKNSPLIEGKKKRPVLLQHALLGASYDWLFQNEDSCLPFMLAENNYDVWLGNFRGNIHSMGHIDPHITRNQYWDFSYHEMGIYDNPSIIDKVLEISNSQKLFYIGMSMGTTTYFITMSKLKEYNDKIILFTGYGPVHSIPHATSEVIKTFAKYQELLSGIGLYSHFGHNSIHLPKYVQDVGSKFCLYPAINKIICSNFLFAFSGFDRIQMNCTALPRIIKYIPNTTSFKTVMHYLQSLNSGIFREYDYRFIQSEGITPVPKEYNLRRISTKIALFSGKSDSLAHPKDVKKLVDLFYETKSLVYFHEISYKNKQADFAHTDFYFAINASQFVYKPTLEIMKLF